MDGNGRVLAFFVADGGVAMATELCGGTAVGEDARRVMDVELAERGLNGGWKSLVARDYSLVDIADNTDSDDESSNANLAWRLRQALL
ncbi:MAG: hypothetical protein IPM39_09000 [Chloroflexi bacterium]|nr:hypothetical protein [Chloroflexota bacterium]